MTSQVVVVDANVWLDYLLGARQNHQAAQDFIMEATRRNVPLVVPVHALKDIFNVVQQVLKEANRIDGKQSPETAAASARETAWAVVDHVMELAAVGPADQSDAWIAAKHRRIHDDFEDDLSIATAMRLDAKLLVTSNEQLVRHAPVPCLTPADARTLIAQS